MHCSREPVTVDHPPPRGDAAAGLKARMNYGGRAQKIIHNSTLLRRGGISFGAPGLRCPNYATAVFSVGKRAPEFSRGEFSRIMY